MENNLMIKEYNYALEKIRSQNKSRRVKKEVAIDISLYCGRGLNLHTGYKLLIDEMRIEKYSSRRKISKGATISQSYISNLCSGISDNPSIDVLVKIAKVLNCTLDELVKF